MYIVTTNQIMAVVLWSGQAKDDKIELYKNIVTVLQ
jgi:hypothetical protein